MLQMLQCITECTSDVIESELLQSYLSLASWIVIQHQIPQFFFFFKKNFEDSSNQEPVLEEEGKYTATIPRLGQFTELIIRSGGFSPHQDFITTTVKLFMSDNILGYFIDFF